ncbi:MAG: hypothetical protein LBP79_00135 [Clostridiales bacterium]|jgi:hypothetical protein|nr:hypothetical protein [Clostridiales bacterium]
MTVGNLIKTALYNIKRRRATSFKIFMGFFLIAAIMIAGVSYNFAADIRYANAIPKIPESMLNYLRFRHIFEFDGDDSEFINALKEISEIRREQTEHYI